MDNSEKKYKVNEQGMIVEEANESEIDDVFRSIQETHDEIEKLIFEKREILTKQNKVKLETTGSQRKMSKSAGDRLIGRSR